MTCCLNADVVITFEASDTSTPYIPLGIYQESPAPSITVDGVTLTFNQQTGAASYTPNQYGGADKTAKSPTTNIYGFRRIQDPAVIFFSPAIRIISFYTSQFNFGGVDSRCPNPIERKFYAVRQDGIEVETGPIAIGYQQLTFVDLSTDTNWNAAIVSLRWVSDGVNCNTNVMLDDLTVRKV